MRLPSSAVKVEETEHIEELSGKLGFSGMDDKLMHSILENDKEVIEDGKLILEAINQGISSFTADNLMEQFVKDFKIAKNIYGNTTVCAQDI